MSDIPDRDAWKRLLYSEAWKQYCHEDNLGQTRNNLFLGIQAALIALLTLIAKPLLETQPVQLWNRNIHLGMTIFGLLAAVTGGVCLAWDSYWKAVIKAGRAYANIRWCSVMAIESELRFQDYGLAFLEHKWRTFLKQNPGQNYHPFPDPNSATLALIEVPPLPEAKVWELMMKVVSVLERVHWGVVIVGISVVVLSVLSGCKTSSRDAEAGRLVEGRVAAIKPLWVQGNLAYWEATTTGKPEAFEKFEKLQLDLRKIYSDPNDFARIEAFRKSGQVRDPRLAREIERLYYAYLPNQIEPGLLERIVKLDAAVQKTYNNYRGTIGGRQVTMSDIYTIMTTEKDVGRREAAWRASKQVGNVIIKDFLELIRLRNESARKLGFSDYYRMSIITGEQDVAELDRIFAELDALTREPYAKLKKELDGILAAGYGIKPEELMPWHYHDPFFQRTPLVYELDLDQYYKGRDIRELCQRYYDGIGLQVDDIYARSDLYDREGKYPHAYGFDADREGDVRVLANLQDTERWMETLLHETGHALYSKYHDRSEPWLLREPAHDFTTEAAAMFFARLSRNAYWMQAMLGLSDEETAKVKAVSDKYLRFQQVLFIRWALVMYHFEKALYADPSRDLNTLWWDLVEKYQSLKRPPGPVDAGWASKLHFTTAPCYYHNYVLGEMLASQWHHYIVHKILGLESDAGVSYVGDPRIGAYFREKVFGPGALYRWDELIVRATGEPLTPKYFVEQFIK